MDETDIYVGMEGGEDHKRVKIKEDGSNQRQNIFLVFMFCLKIMKIIYRHDGRKVNRIFLPILQNLPPYSVLIFFFIFYIFSVFCFSFFQISFFLLKKMINLFYFFLCFFKKISLLIKVINFKNVFPLSNNVKSKSLVNIKLLTEKNK